MKFDVTEEETRNTAIKAALEAGSDFMFAGTWLTLTVYLSCDNIVYEDNNITDETVPWHPVHMNEYAEIINSIIDI